MMDEQQLLGGDWRTRSPDADQEYFIDKMRMLKLKLRKYEEENRVLFRCLAEQKSDVRDALRDKCFVINNVQFEMSELKKHILVLLNVLASGEEDHCDSNDGATTSQVPHMSPNAGEQHQLVMNRNHLLPLNTASEYDKSIWVQRNKTLEENFKKELKKVKELERQIGDLSETLHEMGRDREELVEKNLFIEEENNIQREQISLLEDTVRDLEEVANASLEDVETQTEWSGEKLMAIMNENVEEILCLVNKLTEMQQRNDELESKYSETRRALVLLQNDFHARGKLMSELENELNGLKLLDRSNGRPMRLDVPEEGVLNRSMFSSVSPSSSRSFESSGNSSADFEEEESGISLNEESMDAKKTEVRKFIRNLKNRRWTLHDAYRRTECGSE